MYIHRVHHPRGLVVVDGGPQLGLRIRMGEPRGQHTDDGIGLRIEQNCFANDIFIGGIPPYPEGVGQHDSRRCLTVVVGVCKRAPEYRHDAQHWEEVPRALRIAELLWQLAVRP